VFMIYAVVRRPKHTEDNRPEA